jgi:hypothetical protein
MRFLTRVRKLIWAFQQRLQSPLDAKWASLRPDHEREERVEEDR